ncbi:MAG: SSU ribosomal protein S17p (S11e) [Parcubacteria group bacterium Licking1014_1]|nr:MAG: SSU ribosomal protein S17p (S11e) [Parcubacteria group bacterium Licking1014_1]
MPKKKLTGIIISDKMQKTVVVRVERIKEHPKYKRRYKVHKNYKAHDEKREYYAGDKVVIEETRPISKDKRWKVINKVINKA